MKNLILKMLFLTFSLFLTFVTNAQVIKPYNKGPYHFEPTPTNDKIKFKTNQNFTRTIYIDAKDGKDSNNGLSKKNALKSIDKLMKMDITFGDQILFKGGQQYKGCIDLINLNKTLKENTRDTETSHIHIGSYGKQKAIIDAAGYRAGIWIENTSCVDITDIKITGNGGKENKNITQRYGIRIESTPKIKNSLVHNIYIYNVDLYDIFLLNSSKTSRACNQWDMGDDFGWGWGIYGQCGKGLGIHNVTCKEVNIRNVSQIGIRFRGQGKIDGSENKNCDNIKLISCQTFQTGGPGMQFNRCNNSIMRFCRITESGNRNDNRKWGRGSGMWTWGCKHFLLEYNTFEGAQGIADCCGAHIDFNCSDVVIQKCYSRYNAGGFIEILGLNNNCCYRYNVSLNDGWRDLKDPAQKFWGKVGVDGVILTLNGHNGERKFIGPYNSYIYNNTVINTTNKPYNNPFVFEIATSNKGVLVMNNIFWLPKKCKTSYSMHLWKDGKPYDAAKDFKISYGIKNSKPNKNGCYHSKVRDMNKEEIREMNIVMKNNIYKLNNTLPDKYIDENPIIGNPSFKDINGNKPSDFTPQNKDLINKGMSINKLKTDPTDYGVYFGGLEVKEDFFGTPIKKNIIGAIVPKQ